MELVKKFFQKQMLFERVQSAVKVIHTNIQHFFIFVFSFTETRGFTVTTNYLFEASSSRPH